MNHEPDSHFRSPIIGDLNLPSDNTPTDGRGLIDPQRLVPMLIELNVLYPGGLLRVRQAFYDIWSGFADRAVLHRVDNSADDEVQPQVPRGLALVAPKLYQCALSRSDLHDLVENDQRRAELNDQPPTIFRVWPDFQLEAQIDRSAPTIKADAARRAYDARGKRIVWAVVDSGIDATHPHFDALELAVEGRGGDPPDGVTTGLHRDFSYLVNPQDPVTSEDVATSIGRCSALTDDSGHGTHVAGIIAGCAPAGIDPLVAASKDPGNGGFVPRKHTGVLCGMAPDCELVSLKVMRRSRQGTWVTSSSAIIRALTYIRSEVNVDPAVLRVHGVNMSLGCEWKPEYYAAGQSPLCQAINQVVASGVVVVISAGNYGARTTTGDSTNTSAVLGSITEPAHAEECIAVGSTHRDAPHAFGVTWTSGKGPTLDGRIKPDVVAPGEWIASAATGEIRAAAGLTPAAGAPSLPNLATYAEQSGTSMAAPHVSGAIAAFLSARPEFIGRPQQVKAMLASSATDLGRDRYAQGAGLVDLMRMLANV